MTVFHGLRFPPPPGPWVDQAACKTAGVDRFFPDVERIGRRAHYRAVAEARRVCAGCPVAEPCLAYALDNGVDGVWGGTTHRQRIELRRNRKSVA